MSINRRRAFGLLTVVLGACTVGDDDGSSTSFASAGTTQPTTSGTATSETGTDTGTETDTYGTDDGGGFGDDGYFEDERSAEDVDLQE